MGEDASLGSVRSRESEKPPSGGDTGGDAWMVEKDLAGEVLERSDLHTEKNKGMGLGLERVRLLKWQEARRAQGEVAELRSQRWAGTRSGCADGWDASFSANHTGKLLESQELGNNIL